jgi:hypothetical protein
MSQNYLPLFRNSLMFINIEGSVICFKSWKYLRLEIFLLKIRQIKTVRPPSVDLRFLIALLYRFLQISKTN